MPLTYPSQAGDRPNGQAQRRGTSALSHPFFASLRLTVPLLASVLLLVTTGSPAAADPAAWEALGPPSGRYYRLFTPASGALFVKELDKDVPGEDGKLVRVRGDLLRSDDDGLTWTGLVESDSGGNQPGTARPVDLVQALANDPSRPDELYAAFQHLEPKARGPNEVVQRLVSLTIRRSLDGGSTWSDLGTARFGLTETPWLVSLAVGIDGRFLFAATDRGLYRIALR